jgi:hypothetical protein
MSGKGPQRRKGANDRLYAENYVGITGWKWAGKGGGLSEKDGSFSYNVPCNKSQQKRLEVLREIDTDVD